MTARTPDEKAALVEAGKNTRFGAPNGNRPGMTSERARLKIEAEEKAARLQDKLLTALEQQMDEVLAMALGIHDLNKLNDLIDKINKPTTINLIKTIQDRELGTPRQSIDLSNSDGSFAPPVINIGFVPGVTPDQPDGQS
jgi:hypothetical protein